MSGPQVADTVSVGARWLVPLMDWSWRYNQIEDVGSRLLIGVWTLHLDFGVLRRTITSFTCLP